jgi:sialate O-acetylesterase
MSTSTCLGKLRTTALLVALALLGARAARADEALPFVSPIFSDNMVLQRGISDPVWGWTTPGATVTVRVAGKGASTVADPDGKWVAHLPKLPVGGPFTMTVSGPQSLTLSNILVGDV